MDYALGLDYPIPPPSYIPLDIYTLPPMMSSEIQGGTRAQIGRGRDTIVPSMSITIISSHHKHASLELWVAG